MDANTAPDVQAYTNLNSSTEAMMAIDFIDAARHLMAAGRSKLGAAYNRLEASLRTNSDYADILQGAASRIEDADFAAETAQMAKRALMTKAAIAMLDEARSMFTGIGKLFS